MVDGFMGKGDTMNTDQRLTRAYQRAKVKCFDDTARFVFFSDCHRGDDSVSDEFARNQNIFLRALDYYYRNNYIYVEVGDGDELWEYPKFKHIRLAHSDVFIALKKFYDKKRLIIIYGNHNIYLKSKKFVKDHYYFFYDEYMQDMIELFKGVKPIEALVLKRKNSGQEILVLHGHQGDLMNDQLWRLSMFLLRYFWKFMHVVGFENPSSPARNMYRRHKVEKNYKKWILKHKMMLICGHTHRAKYPKKGELPYFNTGCCTNTRGIPAIEIIGGKILMVNWRIRAAANGTLQVERFLERGPDPIEVFDFREHSFKENIHKKCDD